MVYLKYQGQYFDGCFNHLNSFMGMIDDEIRRIEKKIDKSVDPESDGYCDWGEYIIGYGFIAMQRYITSTYPQSGKNKGKVLKIGDELYGGATVVEIINAGANYWKHEPEWTGSSSDNKNTLNVVAKLTPYTEYTLSNLLAKILEIINFDGELSFSPILPFLEKWRVELDSIT